MLCICCVGVGAMFVGLGLGPIPLTPAPPKASVFTKLALVLMALCMSLPSQAFAGVMGEQCDWTGSGVWTGGRGVTPVYLRCSAGQLSWTFPRGALRVLLRVGATGKEFRGCVRTRGEGARMFLEAPRSLVPLLPVADSDKSWRRKDLVRCFHSTNGQAALYVEAIALGSPGAAPKEEFVVEYDLEPLPRGARLDDECRPCSSQEMVRAYCTSDLVARGYIRSVENDDELEESRLIFKMTRLLRKLPVDGSTVGARVLGPLDANLVSPLDEDAAIWIDGDETTSIRVPRHCGAKHGAGEFVFMARRKLGNLALTCAPRLEDWVLVMSDGNQDGSAHCVLKS